MIEPRPIAPRRPPVTRFAPSPTGHLHLGHAYSAMLAFRAAREGGGRFVLRIEDIDATRCHPEFEAAIIEDLAWLGIAWDEPVRRQSEHMADYRDALARLEGRGLLYPCFCSRADIAREIAAAAHAPHGPDGPIYPGTCRRLAAAERARRIAAGEPHAWRLDVGAAAAKTGPLAWEDEGHGRVAAAPETFGDVVLARRETPTSYHLAVTLDDALQGITLVTRGVDLFASTHVHRLLQALLGLPTPRYRHHPLLLDDTGRRFAKRNKALTLRALREAGHTPVEVMEMIGRCRTT